MSPTARSLQYLRALGYRAEIVEKTIPHTCLKKDLWGADIVALTSGEPVLVVLLTVIDRGQCLEFFIHAARRILRKTWEGFAMVAWLRRVWAYEVLVSSRAWEDIWSFLPGTPKKTIIPSLVAIALLCYWGWDALMDNWGGTIAVGLTLGLIILSYMLVRVNAPLAIQDEAKKEICRLMTENTNLHERLKPTVEIQFRKGDSRYIREQTSADKCVYQHGYFSISNPPGQRESAQQVIVTVIEILPLGHEYNNLLLRFEDQLLWGKRDINPGENRFIHFLTYEKPYEREAALRFYHMGFDGLTQLTWPIPTAIHYTAKIHVTGTHLPLVSKILKFGIVAGSLHMILHD
jgi:hypothetical protein